MVDTIYTTEEQCDRIPQVRVSAEHIYVRDRGLSFDFLHIHIYVEHHPPISLAHHNGDRGSMQEKNIGADPAVVQWLNTIPNISVDFNCQNTTRP